MTEEDRIEAEAIAWHLASAGDDMDWDRFTAWLEADPRHQRCYDEMALSDDLAKRHGKSRKEMALAPQAPAGHRRPRWFAGAIAASLVAAFGFALVEQRADTIYVTGNSARDVALADGSHVELAPHSRLSVPPGEDRLQIDGGAWFDIRHRPDRSLAIAAGPVEIRDIGTRFDVQTDGEAVRIGVAEGNVRVTGATLDHELTLTRGRSLQVAAGMAELGDSDPATMGGWRGGRLTYDNAPLALVTADLARYAQVRVVMDKALRDRRFSGTLAAADGEQQVRDLAQLMGLLLVRDGAGYRLVKRH